MSGLQRSVGDPDATVGDPDPDDVVARRLRVHDLRIEHRKAAGKLMVLIPVALVLAGVTLAKMASSAPVNDLEVQMFPAWVLLTGLAGCGWWRARRTRAACRRHLAGLGALPTGPALAAPAISAAIGAFGAVVGAVVTTLLSGR